MTRRLEDWQLDMILGGDGTPEMEAILASSPADQAQFAQLRAEEPGFFESLFRIECPTSLTLGDLHLGLLDESMTQMTQQHVNLCSHCSEEFVAITNLLDEPIFKTASARTFQKQNSFGLLKRIVMTLEQALGSLGSQNQAVPALRGESWNAYYSGGDYLLSLTRQQHEQGHALVGSILADSVSGQATLAQSSGLMYEAPITASGSFSFNDVTPGAYELVITTPKAELVVPEIAWPA